MKKSATTRLLDAVRAANGDCTDYRAAQLLGISDASVSRWRTGKNHMAIANVSHACELAGIPEQKFEWQIRIGAEREIGPDGDFYREALADLEAVKAGRDPSPSGIFAMVARLNHAAIILIAVAAGFLSVFFPEKSALASTLERSAIDGPRYTLCEPAFDCCRSLLGYPPGFCGLPDLPGHRHSVGRFNGSSPSW